MTKKEKLRALNRFREAINGNNQSKMYEYYLFYDVQIEQILLNLEIDLWKEGYYIKEKIENYFDKMNELKSNSYVLIQRHSLLQAIDLIIDNIDNEND